LIPERTTRSHVVRCSGLFPCACPWNVTFTMLVGRAGATGGRQNPEQMTCPTGGVGPGVAHSRRQAGSVKGGWMVAVVACTIVESYSTVKS